MQAQLMPRLIRHFHTTPIGKAIYHINAKTFRQDFLENPAKHAKDSMKTWVNIFWFGFVPLIAVCAINAYFMEQEHESHFKRRKFVAYDHMYAHVGKKYPWGDGRQSLFFNKEKNCLPTGYIDED